MPAVATILAVLLSAVGLLCIRVGVFDDSLLLLGARLVGAGETPYRDFYTHYGPLGYVALAPVLRAIGNPGLALRGAQAVGLAILTALVFVALRRTDRRLPTLAFPLAVLALSAAFALSAFVGYGLAAAALALYAGWRVAPEPGRRLTSAAAGALLGAAAWTRPAFAAYVGAAILTLELAAGEPASRRRLVLFLGAAAAALPVWWLCLFPGVDPRQAAQEMLLTPAKLLTVGRRHLLADFTRAPIPLALLISTAIAAAPLLWACTVPSRRGRLLAVASIAAGALLPLLPFAARRVDLATFAIFQLAVAIAVAVLERPALRHTPSLWAAAAFGISASAFGHYFWSRPDPQHVFPLLGLAAASACFAWPRFTVWVRAAAVAAFVLAFLPIGAGRELGLPVSSLWKGGLRGVLANAARPGARLKTLWPSGEVPAHVVAAVSLADRLALGSSKFVAYGSDQAWTAGNPVYVFLLSARLPYTKWFQYDPGLQSSPEVQAEMIREIDASGSRSALVWRAEQYRFDDAPAGAPAPSAFDAHVDRVYGKVVGRFGSYEVRTRE